jgi:hypothetical protein
MLKESILFVVGTSALIYFIAPTEKPAEPEAIAPEAQTVVSNDKPPADYGWGDEDESDDDAEAFVFGEPLVYKDSDYADKRADAKDEEVSDRTKMPETKPSQSPSFSRSSPIAAPGSPSQNEKGGVNNPIILKTTNPSSPVDD